jgi:hypothetical protein
MYDDVVSEDIPDDFLGFLEQADERRSVTADQNEEGLKAEKPSPKTES